MSRKIAFIHYHLKTGGVTTVLRQQVEALNTDCDTLVLTGESAASPFPAHTEVIAGLGYDGTFRADIASEEVADSVVQTIRSKWAGGCDLVHVHNPFLAKNRIFLKILNALQQKGINLFLQIHDFAEDGRPQVYYAKDYVQDCHYGVINSRDRQILLESGCDGKGVHLIFNMISPIGGDASNKTIVDNIVLYPIRALRRKNIGEAILLSLFFINNETLSITRPPHSRTDMESYGDWKAYVEENKLDVSFETGMNHDFASLVASSRFLITTSISEGFGFSFLEPWTAHKMLWGRNLVGITRDFGKNGVRLDHLYQRFLVPIEWIGKERLLKKWNSCLDRVSKIYKVQIETEQLGRAFLTMIGNGLIDFGLLDEGFQKPIISRILDSPADRAKLERLNPFLATIGDLSGKDGLIEANKKSVLCAYSRKIYRDRLLDIYDRVENRPVRHQIDRQVLLSRFLDLEHFCLLKWSNYSE